MKFFKIRCGFYPAAAPWAVGRAERVPPTGMSTTICLRGRGSPVGRVPQGTRSTYGHSQKRLTPMAWCRHFSYACARASTAPGVGIRWDASHGGRVPPTGMSITMCSGEGRWDASHGERVPPMGMSRMRHFDRRIVRWDARSAFPLRALAKAPYADGVMLSFFLMPALVRARHRA